ncbi:GyrI-like domain-containing protein [Aquimarina gracilis]|uniref:GyrI-like domain-containing protein n=1 Tax=Aquimarina gracilis TaxID=874422 RepID=A0ABU5ZRH8_9FLAO|nr:GyrI-like domain-containing protein [Aquimarina gracilis]MEB3344652.1 GyrI-like domain-containing protein [Aquimarina gracilis]
MTTRKLNGFHVIGLSVRTRNEDQHVTNDIQNLWNDFMNQGIAHKIPNKIEDTIFGIYTDYEDGPNGDYTLIVGCKVSSLDNVPEGMTSTTIKNGSYSKFTAKGDVTKEAIPEVWGEIWKTDLNRTFATDFEVYDHRAMDPTNAEVDIFVGID